MGTDPNFVVDCLVLSVKKLIGKYMIVSTDIGNFIRISLTLHPNIEVLKMKV